MSTTPTQSALVPKNRQRVLTGIKPTGDLHLGNYAGALKPCIELSQDKTSEVFLMCAVWHGLTDRAKIMEPSTSTLPIVAAILALGFQHQENVLFLQSDFPQIVELSWYLSCVSVVGLLERAHAYKDAVANGKEATAGLFNYPILMSSDILTFDSDIVPVGKDQSQHLEYASDMAKYLNNAVKTPVLKEPKAKVSADAPLLIGTDGERKMSKSYGNTIPLFATKKELEKRVKEIKTDSAGLDDVKNPETCTIYQIFKSFASPAALAHMKSKLEVGKGYGYGHAKADFIAEHEAVFGSKREQYEHYLNSPAEVSKLLEPGYLKATQIADAVLARVRGALQLPTFRG